MSSELSSFLRQHEATVEPLYKDYSVKFWDLSIDGNEQREKALVDSKERYLKVYSNRSDFEKLQAWKDAAAQLPEIEARQFKLIYDTYVPNQIEEDVLRDIVQRETEVENQFNTFRADFEGSKASDNQLRDVLRNETDIDRRR